MGISSGLTAQVEPGPAERDPPRSHSGSMIRPDTRPDGATAKPLRRSKRLGRRTVKPPAGPTLVRTQHLPLLLARGSRRDQDHPVRSNAEAQSPAGAAQLAHRCHLGMPGVNRQRERSTQKPDECRRARTAGSGCPQPAGQSSSAAYRTAVLVRDDVGNLLLPVIPSGPNGRLKPLQGPDRRSP
jgi:hypothetical protein